MRLCLFAAGAAFAAVLSAQETAAAAATDWDKEVDKACTSARLGLRLAASKKAAEAGDAAVPAIRRFAAKYGANAVPVALVEAEADKGGNGEPVVTLLIDWAKDRDFYWRAQAVRGLWLRSRDEAIRMRWNTLASELGEDPAWLVRVYADLTITENWSGSFYNTAPTGGPDPRGRTKFAALALRFTTRGFDANLLEALGDDRTFLGDPWGRRRALEAFDALKQRFGSDCGYKPDAPYADNAAAIEAFVKLVQTNRAGEALPPVPHLTDPVTPFTGGIEILSCKNGDFFLRWRADGELVFGLEGDSSLNLATDTWRELSKERATLVLPAQSGVVVCDKIRLKWSEPDVHVTIAPGALPKPAAEWLKHLAQAIEEAEERQKDKDLSPDRAERLHKRFALRQHLDQFLPR